MRRSWIIWRANRLYAGAPWDKTNHKLETIWNASRWRELRRYVPATSRRVDQPAEAVASAGED